MCSKSSPLPKTHGCVQVSRVVATSDLEVTRFPRTWKVCGTAIWYIEASSTSQLRVIQPISISNVWNIWFLKVKMGKGQCTANACFAKWGTLCTFHSLILTGVLFKAPHAILLFTADVPVMKRMVYVCVCVCLHVRSCVWLWGLGGACTDLSSFFCWSPHILHIAANPSASYHMTWFHDIIRYHVISSQIIWLSYDFMTRRIIYCIIQKA